MENKTKNNLITIPKETVRKQGGAVILDLAEYKRLLKYEMEKEQIDIMVRDGLEEEKQGKTDSMDNFLKKEYPKLYDDYKD